MFAGTGRPISNTLKGVACALLAAAFVAGCSGSDGAAGAPGATGPTGPTGPAGPVLALDVTTAKAITGTITGVSGTASQPTIAFKLVDQIGQPLKGLPASAIRFTAAKLVAGTNGASSQWISYVNRNEAATVVPANATTGQPASWGTAAQRQATAEAATTAGAVYVDKGDGTYTYTFAKDLGQQTVQDNPGPGPAIAFDANATTRVGFEIRATGLNATNNPVYTYVPATGSTTLTVRRDIVNTAECAACHDKLAFHGGPRTDVQYCVTCHNPGTVDAQSGNSLDMKVMVHKIHRGVELPSVVAGGTAAAQGKGYTIWGNSGSFNNFNTIQFTQDQRNCTTCHRESDTSTPQASNWRLVANKAACGACHDDINFATGAGHGSGGIADDTQCLTCHGPTSALTINGKGLKTEAAHVIPELEAAKAFKFEVVRIEPVTGAACAATVKGCKVGLGETAKVTIKVSNPVTSTNYTLTDPAFTNTIPCTPVPPATTCTPTAARLRVRIAYTTQNYTSPGSGSNPGQPILIDFLSSTGGAAVANADGTYTKTAAVAFPASGLIGDSGVVFVEGRTILNVAPTGQPASFAEIGVTSSDPLYFPITGTTATARRAIVNVQKCNDCHKSLQFHGDARNNQTELCATCHNPELATAARGLPNVAANAQPFDFKFMIHSLHAATYKFGSVDFTGVGYPGSLNNCEGCHKPDTYYPVDASKYFSTTIWAGTANGPADDLAITPNVAACSSCHTGTIAKAHMQQNGGVIMPTDATSLTGANQIKAATGATLAPAETCSVCHGPGSTADVKVMHDVASFTFR
jgi:OmcA/MtrC family decaheme c-type cytochrome